ncbi:hypothetical protein CQ017_17525 [Arthrobacter sp. MYb224]|uniref:hypothetical protein n=1 Tax=Arthrobacter sp. MYb224 TaxID=1848600 RepID=UPI000CFA9C14|nr:hypothetical protein [Arthrobacter sp. MYb224]PQZ96532.1 hypothetical protein CQ017_17525 [Arthrobacter sp. MYb224]
MSRSSAIKLIAKIAPLFGGILLLAGALVSFLSTEVSLLLLGLGSLLAWGAVILRQKQSIHDTRTVIRQELRNVNLGSAPVADKATNEASKRLVAVAEKISREQSPVARELHLKTVEEIRFLQAQISEFMKKSHRG